METPVTARMIGQSHRTVRCRYGCCSADLPDGIKNIRRRNRSKERVTTRRAAVAALTDRGR